MLRRTVSDSARNSNDRNRYRVSGRDNEPLTSPAECFDVREVFQAPRRSLVPDELTTSDERQVARTAAADVSTPPRVVPLDAADGAHDVYLNRLDPHLQDLVGIGDVLRAEIASREAERGQSGKQMLGIGRRRPDEDVDVASEAGRAVKGEGVGADDQELNLVGAQRSEELVEVWASSIVLPPEEFDGGHAFGDRPR